MIWTTVSSQSCFCWLSRASPSLAAKNIISLILVLAIWWGPCVIFSCVVGRGYLLWLVHYLGKTQLSLCPASFCTPKPNLPVIPGISWLSTFAFQSPMIKRTSFMGGSSRRSCRSALVQFSRSVVSDSLRPHESHHARPPCPSPTPGVYSNSCP